MRQIGMRSWAVMALCMISPPCLAEAQPVINAVVSVASYEGGVVSPGEMVVIFGTGLGPANLVPGNLDANGRLLSSVAGVAVTFNGIQSPLVYVWTTQVVATVPYELAGLTTAQMQLSFAGSKSQPFTVKVAPTIPGVFSLDA